MQLYGREGLTYSRDLTLPYGRNQLGWTPPSRGRFKLRIEARGPSGPVGVQAQTFRVAAPKPKPKKKSNTRLTPRREPETVEP